MKKIIGNNEKEKNKIYWDNFYRNVNIQEESPFCKFIKSYNSENVFILDIGCGSGRDTFAFAKEGYNVVGIDRSEEAIKSNNLLKEKMDNISENIEFKVIDISNKKEFGQLIQKLSNKAEFQKLNFMIYTRFFIHAIDEEAEKILLSTISEYLKTGDYFVAEFRTKENENQKKIYENHYRRYIDAELFLDNLESKFQFEKEYFQKGTGLAIYNEEDPYICRIIAKKI